MSGALNLGYRIDDLKVFLINESNLTKMRKSAKMFNRE